MLNRRRDDGRRRKFEQALDDLVERLKRPLHDMDQRELNGLARTMTRLRFSWDARPPIAEQ
jgi:hypothetical protein